MKTAVLSCFYPYRGGISQFSACMLLELGEEHDVKAFNFRRQYPSALFPGTTQFVTPEDDATMVPSVRILDSIRPSTWLRTAKAILRWKPDAVYVSWWQSFFGPSLGFVARYLKRRGVKVVGIMHNVIPHEPHFWDKPLTKYFLGGCDGAVTLGDEGSRSLKTLGDCRSVQLFHPVYSQFGESIPRENAEKALGIRKGCKNLLFFGLIRPYKGLDILIKAFGSLPEDCQLIIAGEPYGSFAEYQALIDASPARERIHCRLGYVPDIAVKEYFSAADLSVLPYRSASQSGVLALSYNFGVPVVATDTGSLRRDIEGAGTGLIAPEATPEALAKAIRTFFDTPGLPEKLRSAAVKELERLSWKNFCRELTAFTESL